MAKLKLSPTSKNVTFQEKCNEAYGRKVAFAIKSEWFTGTNNLYNSRNNEFKRKRQYAIGKQPIDIYKKIICGENQDLKWQFLDFEPLKLMPIFVDKICNGVEERLFRIKAEAINHFGVNEKKKHKDLLYSDMKSRPMMDDAKALFGIDLYNFSPDEIPLDEQELEIYMETQFKLPIEIAIEKVIKLIFNYNKMDLVSSKMVRDLVVLGVAGGLSRLEVGNGIKLEYVDPEYCIYPLLKTQNFEGAYYFGEIKRKTISELASNTEKAIDWESVQKSANSFSTFLGNKPQNNLNDLDNFEVDVLYFYYKTSKDLIYKKKKRKAGSFKMIKKDEMYLPREKDIDFHERVDANIETWFEGVYILGSDILLEWKECDNQVRKENTLHKSIAPFSLYAHNIYEGEYDSLVGRMIKPIDNIQLSHLKIQHLKGKIKPDGVVIDPDALQEIDLGDGKAFTPLAAVKFFEETGNVISRSLNSDGSNSYSQSIRNNATSSNSDKIALLANDIRDNLSLMVQAIGANQQAENPDSDALYSVQKLASLNSNQATRHIRTGILNILKEMSIITIERLKDIQKYSNLKEFIRNSIGDYSYSQLESLSNIGAYETGIVFELKPDAEEYQNLMNDISSAINLGLIDVTDKIDILEIENYKESSQLLKTRIKRNRIQKQKEEQSKIKMNEESQINISRSASEAKMQADQMNIQGKLQLIQAETQKELIVLEKEAELKHGLMEREAMYKKDLYNMEQGMIAEKEIYREDRKDERENIKASNQSELNFQKKNNGLPKKFNSENDTVGDGISMGDVGMNTNFTL